MAAFLFAISGKKLETLDVACLFALKGKKPEALDPGTGLRDYAGKHENGRRLSKMARGMRKPASDSTRQQIEDQQRPDLSAAEAPRDTPGTERLNEYGLRVFDQLFRSRADWTIADLVLIAMAADSLQRINEIEAAALGLTETPLDYSRSLAMIETQRTNVKNCLRDASLRRKDGTEARTAPARPSTGTGTKAGGNVASFDEWLN